jgi:4-hydroxyphenylpyruvate dioxygenase
MNNTNPDFLPLLGTDHIELFVGNAKQASFYYQQAFGFELIAYSGPETGSKNHASYVLKQGKIRLVLSSALNDKSEIAQHVLKHGDGVKFLSLTVDDAIKSFEETIKRGAKVHKAPQKLKDEFGDLIVASIHTYGDTVHRFVERKNYRGVFMPGYIAQKSTLKTTDLGFEYVDHCVGNVELGSMDEWVEFYKKVMGFNLLVTFDDEDISTEYSALMSKVVSNGNGYIKFPINEPAQGKKKSQIEEYLDFYKGAGVQQGQGVD